MVTDYERAWVELQQLVASKTQHGREGLLTEMAEIASRCRVPAGELSRLLRLYGVEVERARAIAAESDRDEELASGGQLEPVGFTGAGMAVPRTSSTDLGGHDGRSNGSSGER